MPEYERMLNALANMERLLGLVLRVLREARQECEKIESKLKAPRKETRRAKGLKRRRGGN